MGGATVMPWVDTNLWVVYNHCTRLKEALFQFYIGKGCYSRSMDQGLKRNHLWVKHVDKYGGLFLPSILSTHSNEAEALAEEKRLIQISKPICCIEYNPDNRHLWASTQKQKGVTRSDGVEYTSIKEAAYANGVDPAAVGAWCRGDYNPSIDYLFKYSTELNFPIPKGKKSNREVIRSDGARYPTPLEAARCNSVHKTTMRDWLLGKHRPRNSPHTFQYLQEAA